MRRKTPFVLLGVLVLVAAGVCAWVVKSRSTWNPGWERGELKVSERAYYMGRVTSLADTWKDMAYRARRVSDGRIEDSPFTCLVVDTAGKRLWLECEGQPLPGYETELPSRMEWTLRRSTPQGLAKLAPLVRLRIQGVYTNRLPLEQIFLIGTRDDQEHVYFSFSPSGQTHGDYYTGPLQEIRLTWNSSKPRASEVEKYGSIVVSNADYAQAKTRFKPGEPAWPEPAGLRENRAAWRRVEKTLYQEIERQVWQQGLPLRQLAVTCGPDYTAAAADLQAERSGLWDAIRRGPAGAHVYLHIDCLGDDVWYARNAAHPRQRVLGPMRVDLEFLVSTQGPIPEERRPTLLAKGRQKQKTPPGPPAPWQAELANGATVELIGICANPSGDRPWWGPDGSPLDFAPYINYERYGPEPQDRIVYEIVWQVHPPPGPSGIRSTMEGAQGTYDHQVRDRYGEPIYGTLRGTGYSFDRGREKTTLRVGVNSNEGPYAWVTFKNISLVPGKNMGFGIVPGGGDAEGRE